MFKKLLMACLFLMHSLAFAGGDLMIHVDDIGDGRVVVWRNERIYDSITRRIKLQQFLQELETYISANETLTARDIVRFFEQRDYRLEIVNDNHSDYLNPNTDDKNRIALRIGGGILGGGVVTGVLVLVGTITGGMVLLSLPIALIGAGISIGTMFQYDVAHYERWSGPAMEEVMEAVHEALAGQEDVDWEIFVEQ